MNRRLVRISERDFRKELNKKIFDTLSDADLRSIGMVTGPGRSGAIAAVYTSHILRIPFIPYKQKPPRVGRMLIVDTALETGATIRKAMRIYADYEPLHLVVYMEPPRVIFWYERDKPQFFRHEEKCQPDKEHGG